MSDTNSTLLQQAKQKMADDMKVREIGAIVWNVAEAGFHYIPEIVVSDIEGDPKSVRITGLYNYNGNLYAIEEGVADVDMERFYRRGVDVPPVVVTLSLDKANELLGDPENKPGFTTAGTLEEWVAVADCYFEALAED
ncbi:MAG: hypothetical protein HDS12_02230 [Bacteroides sp.]|nr:hypothetical protein [Bacteroidales bacterium]MBD5223252.1 hypothetical protein [Bacteroidales bacterium]MBD5302923.1 hypothetical protein [Bacteroides sp.]MBD5305095.1 hypothetical protein [Bacteroides sp.]MBD5347984.1 hypothetical protein [Bacteroides sp.]